MWGASWEELAKKAQEASSGLAELKLQSPATSLFNLDSMLEEENDEVSKDRSELHNKHITKDLPISTNLKDSEPAGLKLKSTLNLNKNKPIQVQKGILKTFDSKPASVSEEEKEEEVSSDKNDPEGWDFDDGNNGGDGVLLKKKEPFSFEKHMSVTPDPQTITPVQESKEVNSITSNLACPTASAKDGTADEKKDTGGKEDLGRSDMVQRALQNAQSVKIEQPAACTYSSKEISNFCKDDDIFSSDAKGKLSSLGEVEKAERFETSDEVEQQTESKLEHEKDGTEESTDKWIFDDGIDDKESATGEVLNQPKDTFKEPEGKIKKDATTGSGISELETSPDGNESANSTCVADEKVKELPADEKTDMCISDYKLESRSFQREINVAEKYTGDSDSNDKIKSQCHDEVAAMTDIHASQMEASNQQKKEENSFNELGIAEVERRNELTDSYDVAVSVVEAQVPSEEHVNTEGSIFITNVGHDAKIKNNDMIEGAKSHIISRTETKEVQEVGIKFNNIDLSYEVKNNESGDRDGRAIENNNTQRVLDEGNAEFVEVVSSSEYETSEQQRITINGKEIKSEFVHKSKDSLEESEENIANFKNSLKETECKQLCREKETEAESISKGRPKNNQSDYFLKETDFQKEDTGVGLKLVEINEVQSSQIPLILLEEEALNEMETSMTCAVSPVDSSIDTGKYNEEKEVDSGSLGDSDLDGMYDDIDDIDVHDDCTDGNKMTKNALESHNESNLQKTENTAEYLGYQKNDLGKPKIFAADDAAGSHESNASFQTEEPGQQTVQEVPQFAIEKFMSQLERLHAQHENELQEMEKKHQSHVEELHTKLENVASRSRNSSSVVASHDKCLAQQRQLERDFNIQLEEKEKELSEALKNSKEIEAQMQVMKRDKEKLAKSMKVMEGRIEKVDQKDTEIKSLTDALTKSKAELESSNEAFSSLKARVKVVATELKERRNECRNLNTSVQELTLLKSSLDKENSDLQSKLTLQCKMNEENDGEIETLSSKVTKLQNKIKELDKALVERDTVGDKVLTAYKKKAHASLASANARAAAANQAREEAEIDASNARTEAQNSLEAAQKAEIDKEAAVEKALEELKELLDQVDTYKSEVSTLNEKLMNSQERCSLALKEAEESRVARETLLDELNSIGEELSKERENSTGLVQELTVTRIKCQTLQSDNDYLKEELQKSASAAFMEKQKQSRNDEEMEKSGDMKGIVRGAGSGATSESDGTIVMLQQELKGANDAIKDLKEVLCNILKKNPSAMDQFGDMESLGIEMNEVNGFGPSSERVVSGNQIEDSATSNTGNDTTPLYFAIEKQAELNTARNEINRLANLLGDAEAAKMEAYDATEIMKRKMEEAEARLRRYEKLGPASSARHSSVGTRSSTVNYSGYGSSVNSLGISKPYAPRIGEDAAGGTLDKSDLTLSSHNDSTVNLEYLKNVMLSYLNAKTLSEKKALVPVVAAVLELTPDEQMRAIQNVEESAGIQGVGTSLLENVQSKGFVNGLFG